MSMIGMEMQKGFSRAHICVPATLRGLGPDSWQLASVELLQAITGFAGWASPSIA